jgi:hypothetical protein
MVICFNILSLSQSSEAIHVFLFCLLFEALASVSSVTALPCERNVHEDIPQKAALGRRLTLFPSHVAKSREYTKAWVRDPHCSTLLPFV